MGSEVERIHKAEIKFNMIPHSRAALRDIFPSTAVMVQGQWSTKQPSTSTPSPSFTCLDPTAKVRVSACPCPGTAGNAGVLAVAATVCVWSMYLGVLGRGMHYLDPAASDPSSPIPKTAPGKERLGGSSHVIFSVVFLV